jgi:hypothetical protein
MKMEDVVLQAPKQQEQFNGVSWIVDFIGLRPTMAGDIDDRTRNVVLVQVASNRYKVALDSSLRRRIWTELKHSHWEEDERK